MNPVCRFFICVVALAFFLTSGAEGQPPVDHSIWGELLKKHVSGASVDYRGFKKDEQRLDQYLAVLSETRIKELSGNEQFAFYINAYNAFTVKLILTRYPGINSIKEIGSFFTNPWQKKFIPLSGRTVTLDYIEHEVLRPKFKDPRVHFAINCASRGCPPLRCEPYEAKKLEEQLDEQAAAFINNPDQNFLKDNRLHLSKIFKWFEEDFNDKPVRFVRRYAQPGLKEAIDAAGDDLKVSYLPYDWSLNQ